MNIARFEPWGVVDLLHRDLDRLAARRLPLNDTDGAVTDWVPAVDIIEEKDRFVLRADLPGVQPADIDVSMDAGVLSVSSRTTENRCPACLARAPGDRTVPPQPGRQWPCPAF